MANKKSNMTAWILKFVGSLAYLYVLWWLWGMSLSGTFSAVLFGLAAVTSVGFFITTVVSLMANNGDMQMWSTKAALMAGFALLALTFPTSTWTLFALVGFILAYVGNGMDKSM